MYLYALSCWICILRFGNFKKAGYTERNYLILKKVYFSKGAVKLDQFLNYQILFRFIQNTSVSIFGAPFGAQCNGSKVQH